MPLHQIQSRKRAADVARKPASAPRAAPKRAAPAKRVTVGLLVGNRGFFPGHLAREGRDQMLAVLKEEGFDVVALGANDTRSRRRGEPRRSQGLRGAVQEAPGPHRRRGRHAAQLRRRARRGRDAAPGRACTSRCSCTPPPTTRSRWCIDNRRDAFCGKMSVCNVLTQYGIPYSLTTLHTVAPGVGELSRRTCAVRRRCAAWSTACARRASAPSARGRRRSRPCATARRSSRRRASPWNRSTSRRSSAGSERLDGQRPRRASASSSRCTPT